MTKMVIEIPDELKSAVQPFLAFVDVAKEAIGASAGGKAIDYAAVERNMAEASAAVERSGHEAVLRSLDVNAKHVVISGERYRRVGRYPGSYKTVAGEVKIERSLYRRCGVRNDATVDMISVRTGAIGDGWLPQAARGMSHLLSKETSRDAEKTVRELGRLPYSRSSFETAGHLVGAEFVRHRAEIEDALIAGYAIPETARSVSIAIDRVSVPMEEPRKRPVGRPRKDAPKKPCEVVYRMAYCATLTMHDAKGEALHTIRHGRMPSGDPDALADQLDSDLRALLHKDENLNVCLLADGAHELWNLLEARISEESVPRGVWRLVDFWHVIEKLASAAVIMFGNDTERTAALARWRTMLLNRYDGPQRVLQELKASGREWVSANNTRPVHEAITYFTNHHDRMNYAAARQAGLPIGSGNVEATCKTLVTMRMKRPGARWKNDTGDHVLQLRALTASDRWNEAMTLLFAKRATPVRRAA